MKTTNIILLLILIILSTSISFSVTCTLHDPNTFDGSACDVTIDGSELNGYDAGIPISVTDDDYAGTGIFDGAQYNVLLFLNNDITSVIVEIQTSGGAKQNTTLPLNQCIMQSGFYPQYADPYMLITIQDNFNGNDYESMVSCSFINGGVHDDILVTDPVIENGGTGEVWIHFEYEATSQVTEYNYSNENGEILFSSNPNNLTLNDSVNIEYNFIEILDESLNVPANITFYNINLNSPYIYHNGIKDNNQAQYNLVYDNILKQVSFSVNSWSNYSVENDTFKPSILFTNYTDNNAITRYDDNKIYIGLSCEDDYFDYIKINLFDNSNNLMYSLYTNETDVQTILTKSDDKIVNSWEVTELTTLSGLTLTGIDSTPNGDKIIVSTNGYVYMSINYGATWRILSNLTSQYYSDVDITDNGNNIAVSVSGAGYVYASVDGGYSFAEHSELGTQNWQQIAISNDGRLYGSVYNAFSYYYNGSEWLMRDGVPATDPYCKLFRIDDDFSKLYVIYEASAIGRVDNLTEGSLVDITPPQADTESFCSVDVSDDEQLIIVTSESAFYYVSRDGATTWENETYTNGHPLCSIEFSDDNQDIIMTNCYAGFESFISTNAGVSFTKLGDIPVNAMDIKFADNTFYYISDNVYQVEEQRDNLSFGTYKYSGVCYDLNNNYNSTATRTITLTSYVAPPVVEENPYSFLGVFTSMIGNFSTNLLSNIFVGIIALVVIIAGVIILYVIVGYLISSFKKW